MTGRLYAIGRRAGLALGIGLGVALAVPGAEGRAQTCGLPYTVKAGDTLISIAQAVYGTASQYLRLYALNRTVIGPNADALEVGTVLSVPCQTGASFRAVAPSPDPVSPAQPDRAPKGWSKLPDAAALAGWMAKGAQVVDIRPTAVLGAGVIPGSLSLPYGRFRGPKENPGAPPDDAALSALVGQSGLRLDRPIVIVPPTNGTMDQGRAAYVYWVLKSVGAQSIAILQGGLKGWVSEGRPMARRPRRAEPYDVTLTLSDQWRAGIEQVEAIASGSVKGALLDGRPGAVFDRRSSSGQSLPSTLPGAKNSSAPASFKALRTAQSRQEGVFAMLGRLKDAKVNWESEPVVSFCDTGEMSALNWFYASEVAGIRNVKLYPESLAGWKQSGRKMGTPAE